MGHNQVFSVPAIHEDGQYIDAEDCEVDGAYVDTQGEEMSRRFDSMLQRYKENRAPPTAATKVPMKSSIVEKAKHSRGVQAKIDQLEQLNQLMACRGVSRR